MKISVDTALCIGSTSCLGPSMLEMNETGNKIQVIGDGSVPEDETEAVEDSVDFCPVGALLLQD